KRARTVTFSPLSKDSSIARAILEGELQRKLDVTPPIAMSRNVSSSFVEAADVRLARVDKQVRVVESVEHLRAKLQLIFLRDKEFLRETGDEIPGARPAEDIARGHIGRERPHFSRA